MSEPVFTLLVDQLEVRIINESVSRIKKCLQLIKEEELWLSPHAEITSIGSTILHLRGNATQWLNSIHEGKQVDRNRDAEFFPDRKWTKTDLEGILNDLSAAIHTLIPRLKEIDPRKSLTIQTLPTNPVDAIVHVIEHFSYHTGQITLLTKLFTGKATDYYAHVNLNE